MYIHTHDEKLGGAEPGAAALAVGGAAAGYRGRDQIHCQG